MNWARDSWACMGPGGPGRTRVGPGHQAHLVSGKGFGKETSHFGSSKQVFLQLIFSPFSQPFQPPQPPLLPEVTATAPPPRSRLHRAEKPDLQEVGSGFYAFGVSCVLEA